MSVSEQDYCQIKNKIYNILWIAAKLYINYKEKKENVI